MFKPINFSFVSKRLNKILLKTPVQVIDAYNKKQEPKQSSQDYIKSLSDRIRENKATINKLYKREADQSDNIDR